MQATNSSYVGLFIIFVFSVCLVGRIRLRFREFGLDRYQIVFLLRRKRRAARLGLENHDERSFPFDRAFTALLFNAHLATFLRFLPLTEQIFRRWRRRSRIERPSHLIDLIRRSLRPVRLRAQNDGLGSHVI